MGEEEKKSEDKKVEGQGKQEEGKKQEEGEKKAEGGGGGDKKEEKKDDAGKKEGEGGGGEGEKKAESGGGGGGGGGGEGEGEKKETPPPPPPEEIVMRVYMHCEGCARKVRRSLKGFEGVEDVTTDCRTHKVVVKGKVAAADPLKVVDRVQKKSGRKVELLTPIPPKPEKEEKKEEKEKRKPQEKKEEPPVIAVVLKVHMHCEACSQEIKKRILKMKGVQSVDPDLKNSQVTVKGVLDPPKLVEYVYKRTGKHAVVVRAEPVEKKADDDKGKEEGKDEKKGEGGEGEKKAEGGEEGEKEKKEGGGGGGGGEGEKKAEGGGEGEKEKKEGGAAAPAEDPAAAAVAMAMAAAKLGEMTKNPFYYYYPRYQVEYAYPPQIFSDENPNACSVM